MNSPNSSSKRVPYDLRPRKQIERRMMGHTFYLLAEAGFPISTYRYAGFGAFFFVDFILFRRMLGISDMVSLEHDTSRKKRVLFNRPFHDICIEFKSSSDYIAELTSDRPYILWLDYDGPLSDQHLSDITIACSRLYPTSIIIVTIDVDFDKAYEIRDVYPKNRKGAWRDRFMRECGDRFDPTWTESDFGASQISTRTVEMVSSAIIDGVNMRDEITFEKIFHFLYADGHDMLTFGGIICNRADRRKLNQIEWNEIPFACRQANKPPFRIEFPVLTRKERLYMDSEMPCEQSWTPNEFELDEEEVQQYSRVHRYSPSYAELFL